MVVPVPKYNLIAEQLIRDIKNGVYRVGDKLPTENELMIAFSASRHTVRNALRILRRRMIAESRQGSGSKVISSGMEPTFMVSIQSLDELVAFSQESRRTILEWGDVIAGPDLADSMSCKSGRRLIWICMLRSLDGPTPISIAFTNVWIDALYKAVIPEIEQSSISIAEIIANRFGCETHEVVQTVGAGAVNSEAAKRLGRKENAPALVIERSYSAIGSESAHIFSRTICASDNVKLVSRFRASVE